jgi:hypothetical protein
MTSNATARATVLALIGTAVAAGLIAAIGMERMVAGSVAGHWVYPFFHAFEIKFVIAGLVGSLVLLLALRLSRRLAEGHEIAAVVLMVAAGFLTQLALKLFAFAPPWAIVRSDRANGYYGPASHLGIVQFLSTHGPALNALPAHARTNMPGKFVLFKLLFAITPSPAMIALMLIFLSVVGAVGVYLVARELEADRRAALCAMAIYLVLPGRAVFLPILNTITPIAILLVFWLFLRALRAPSMRSGALIGAAMFAMVFFEPLPLVSGWLFLAALWHAIAHKGKQLRDYGTAFAAAIGGFLCVYLIVRVATGYDLFANLAYVVRDAREFNASDRPYGIWAMADPLEFALAAGAAATVVFLGQFAYAEHRRWSEAMNVFAAACLATILILDLLGLNRGEVTRLWIFLAALVAIPVGARLGAARTLLPCALVIVALAAQASIQSGMIAFVIP